MESSPIVMLSLSDQSCIRLPFSDLLLQNYYSRRWIMANVTRVGERFRAQVRLAGHPSKAKTFDTQAEAEVWGADTEAAMRGHATPSKDWTLAGIIKWYREEIEGHKKLGRTTAATLAMWERDQGKARIADMSPAWVVRWAKGRGVKPQTVQQDLVILGGVLRLARAMGKLPKTMDPIGDAREPLRLMRLVGSSAERDRRPTQDELDALKRHFRDKRRQRVPMWDIIDFLTVTAMRAGEVARLRWADLDVSNRTILIRDRKDPTEKMGNDQRIPLLAVAGLDAFEIVMRQPRRSDLIFPYNAATWSTIFPRACEALGIVDLHLHDARHEGTSRMFEAGFAMEEVILVTGHRDPKTLLRYTQLRPESLHRTAQGRAEKSADPKVSG